MNKPKKQQAAAFAMSTMDAQEKAQTIYRGAILAPMVRASTTPLRTLALKYGADAVYSEEMVDRSLFSTIRYETNEGFIDYRRDTSGYSEKVKRRLAKDGGPPLMMRIDPSIEKGRFICQLGTGEPDLALKAALHVHRDVDAIDINMGCPKKFSVSGGMGSALLSDPQRAGNIIRTLRDNIPSLPVSCKIRLIKDTRSTLDFCTAMINSGALAVAIHARRVGDDSTQAADWKTLREVVPLLKSMHPSVPVLLNGDFYTRKEWTEMMEETGANGVLLARPALYNTSIFRKPSPGQTGEYGYNSPLLLDKTTVIQDYLRECLRYNVHYRNVKYVICEMMNNRRAPPERCPFLLQDYPGEQTIAKTCDCPSIESICNVWNMNTSLKTNQDAQAPAAGEHKYEDSYFLGAKQANEGKSVVGDERTPKRLRLDENTQKEQ